jgi:hypothetical protein
VQRVQIQGRDGHVGWVTLDARPVGGHLYLQEAWGAHLEPEPDP